MLSGLGSLRDMRLLAVGEGQSQVLERSRLR